MKTLVTGGAGYIGSHCVRQLVNSGYDVLVIDNLSRGHKEAIPDGVAIEQVDLIDGENLRKTIKEYDIDSIIHFAALAYVGESVEKPGMYYENNVIGSFNLIRAAARLGIKKFVFSSTCSIYGNPKNIPISENEPDAPINPYANTKLTIEKMLRDFDCAHNIKSVSLRYFNAAGADPSGEIGESHSPESHIIPLVIQSALGQREKVFIFGDDYETKDGTCIRDYIHVNDLVSAHIQALKYLNDGGKSTTINLGTGKGNTVLEIINSVSKLSGNKVNYEIIGRRSGDPAALIADNKKANEVLGWSPIISLDKILTTAWNWHSNPKY